MLRTDGLTPPTIDEVLAHPFFHNDDSLEEEATTAGPAPSIEDHQGNEGDKSGTDSGSEFNISSPEPEPKTAVLETVSLTIVFSSAEEIVGGTSKGSSSEAFTSQERVGLTRHASWPEVMSAE